MGRIKRGMKMNYKAKAEANKSKLIASGELARIADRAIAAARKAIVGIEVIDAADMLASQNSITRHIGSQIDGAKIEGATSAKVELDSAAREIFKMGKIGGQVHPEANAQWSRIKAVAAELKI